MIAYEIALWVIPVAVALTTLLIGVRGLVFCWHVITGKDLDGPRDAAAGSGAGGETSGADSPTARG